MARILVAMSGGVDSSVAAALLVRQGHEVAGVTLRLLPRLDSGFGCCGSPKDIEDARDVCQSLGIAHYVLSPTDLFEDRVIAPFVRAYQDARTPSPCSDCNRGVKFPYLLALAEASGARALATGHYARVEERDGAYRLLKAADARRDQSYFLHGLTQRELSRSLFPLGGLAKEDVRAEARALGLKTADKPDRQDLCFIPQGDYRAFLEDRLEAQAPGRRPGPVRDTSGALRGTHGGLSGYTIGQRKGLGVSGGSPLFVVSLEPETNTVVVGPEEELASASCRVTGLSWTAGEPEGPFEASVRLRHRHREAPAVITPGGGRAEVRFAEPQRAVTPGQAAVFYRGDEVLGGGLVERAA